MRQTHATRREEQNNAPQRRILLVVCTFQSSKNVNCRFSSSTTDTHTRNASPLLPERSSLTARSNVSLTMMPSQMTTLRSALLILRRLISPTSLSLRSSNADNALYRPLSAAIRSDRQSYVITDPVDEHTKLTSVSSLCKRPVNYAALRS